MKKLGLLAVRAHSGAIAGYGHAMRCKALAQEWAHRGGSVCLLADRLSSAAVTRDWVKSGFLVKTLSGDPGTVEDAEQTADNFGAAFVVLDGYCFNSGFQDLVSRCVPTVCIDDCAQASPYSADIILSQDIGYGGAFRFRAMGSTKCVLQGPEYILLRSEFDRWRGRVIDLNSRKSSVNVLMTAGGSNTDLLPLFIRVADVVNRSLQGVKVFVMASSECLGRLDLDLDAYEANIILDTSDVAEVMSRMDFAISGGGTTLLELAFMGIPTWAVIGGEIAHDQLPMVRELERRGVVSLFEDRHDFDGLCRLVASLSSEATDRYHTPKNIENAAGRLLVDGLGASRVVDVMEEYLS